MTPWKGLLPVLMSAFWFVLWLFSLGLLLDILLLRWWPGDRLLIVRLVNYALPWLLAALFPALLLAGLSGRKGLLLSLLLPTILILLTYFPQFYKNRLPAPGDGLVLKVMSYNIWSQNLDLAASARVIAQANPDILLLQELSRLQEKPLQQLLADLFPGEKRVFAYNPPTSQAIFSRYPLTIEPVKGRSPVQKTSVQTPGGAVTFFNAHFQRTVLRRRSNWQRLHDQVTQVLTKEIAQTAGPLILGGDFNMTDQTETYRMVAQQLHNAHWEVGRGFGFTFPSARRRIKGRFSLPPLVRIDHLFYAGGLVALRAETLPDAGGSDHFPIVAEFALPAR